MKRLVASFAVAGRDRGFDEKTRTKINAAVGRSYREAMQEFGAMGNMDVWYARVDIEDLLREVHVPRNRRAAEADGEESREDEDEDSLKAFAKLTEVVDGEARIISDPPLIVPIAELAGPEQAAEVQRCAQGSDPPVPADALAAIAAICSSGSVSSMPPGRWSASAASARAPGSC